MAVAAVIIDYHTLQLSLITSVLLHILSSQAAACHVCKVWRVSWSLSMPLHGSHSCEPMAAGIEMLAFVRDSSMPQQAYEHTPDPLTLTCSDP